MTPSRHILVCWIKQNGERKSYYFKVFREIVFI